MNMTDIEKVLDEIRPALKQDGGDVEAVKYSADSGDFEVRFLGHCVGCPYARQTLEQGIEKLIKSRLPEVKRVILAE